MPHQPNPVQSVSQLGQKFARPRPQLQQQIVGGPPGAPPVEQQMQELALEVYARLIAGRCNDPSYAVPIDSEEMRELASTAQSAAKAYYEKLGVRFNEGEQGNG